MRVNSVILIVFVIIGCSQEKKKLKVAKKITHTKSSNKPNDCKIDSITIIEFDSLINTRYVHKDSLSSSDPDLIRELKPFLIDSVKDEYCCCPENLFGEINIYSNGEICSNYLIALHGRSRFMTYDTLTAFLFSGGYRYKTEIPKNIWRKTLRDLKENRK